MLYAHKFIETDCLFLGTGLISPFLPEGKKEELINEEFYEWISAVYWGEKLGVDYAFKMTEISPNEELRSFWFETYKHELDHLTRITDWLLVNGVAPTAPTLMMKRVLALMDKHKKAKSYDQYQEVIEKGQVFLEETGACLIKWRLGFIKDRMLKSIFYKIYRDEMGHISQGKRTLLSLNKEVLPKKDNLQQNIKALFPLHIVKKHLEVDQLISLKNSLPEILEKETTRIIGASTYRPLQPLSIFEDVDGYERFGCKPTRSEGLLLEPKIESDNSAFDIIKFNSKFSGMNGLAHGGFISMALDEMMGYSKTLHLEKFSLTTNLNVEFKLPVKIDRDYVISSRIISIDGSLVKCIGSITDCETGKIAATSQGTFHLVNEKLGHKLFPGIMSNTKTSTMVIPNVL